MKLFRDLLILVIFLGTKTCELCKFDFIMQTRIRSLKNWEKLDMNNMERRRVLCTVTFHLILIICVIWTSYVLIERTANEIKEHQTLEWAFWIKLVVVAMGFTGGVVFMYMQFKTYLNLCRRWRQYNRVIIIQPITEEYIKNSKKKFMEKQQQQQANNSNTTTNNNGSVQQQQTQPLLQQQHSAAAASPSQPEENFVLLTKSKGNKVKAASHTENATPFMDSPTNGDQMAGASANADLINSNQNTNNG
jgi:hypothetical protein